MDSAGADDHRRIDQPFPAEVAIECAWLHPQRRGRRAGQRGGWLGRSGHAGGKDAGPSITRAGAIGGSLASAVPTRTSRAQVVETNRKLWPGILFR